MKFYIISGIFLFLGSFTGAAPSCKSLPCIGVDIYYQSLCKDCHYFFHNQLAPSYPTLKDHLDINFIPYGKADHIKNKKKQWLFRCEHGKLECQGNKAQACALEVIKKTSASEKKQKDSVNLVNCVMLSVSPMTSVPKCAKAIGLSNLAEKKINKCAESSAGDDLLAAYGEKTHSLQSPLRVVPTIVINGVYSDHNQNAASHGFKSLICDYLKLRGRRLPSCA